MDDPSTQNLEEENENHRTQWIPDHRNAIFVIPESGLHVTARARRAALIRSRLALRQAAWEICGAEAVRLACTMLRTAAACVSAEPEFERSPVQGRTYVRLIVRDQAFGVEPVEEQDDAEYEFLRDTTETVKDELLLLRPCPSCGRAIATYSIRSLADLGDVIFADEAEPPHRLPPSAHQYTTDPVHQPDCPEYRPIRD